MRPPCAPQVEGAVKRAPLEERKKRKQEAAAGEQQQPADQAKAAAAEQPAAAAAGEPAAKKPRAAKAPRPRDAAAVAATEAKHKWLRAVAVGGLTPDTLPAALQMARAAGEVEEVVQPVPDTFGKQFMLRRDGCTGEAFIAVYKSVKQAVAAVARLHGQPAAAAARPGKKGGAPAAAAAGASVWARQLSGEGLHQKRWRLIVRNLPFNVSEAGAQAALLRGGAAGGGGAFAVG